MKKLVSLILFLGIFLVNLNSVSAVISCGSQTYPDGSGYCCDTGNGANGVWFRGDYYSSCPAGTFRYVNNINPSCSDAGAGTYAQPWCTMGKANTALSGNIVIFLGGVYNEAPIEGGEGGVGMTMRPQNGGTLGNPTIFKGHPDYPRTIVMGKHNGPTNSILLSSYDGDYWNRCAGLTNYVTTDHMEFTQCFGGGIIVGPSIGVTVQDSVVHDTVGSGGSNHAGLRVPDEGGDTTNLLIRGNYIYNVTHESDGSGMCGAMNCGAIVIYRHNNATIEDNIFQDVPAGTSFKGSTRVGTPGRTTVRGNKYINAGEAYRLNCDYGSNSHEAGKADIYENIFYGIWNVGVFLHNDVFQSCGASGGNYDQDIIHDVKIFNNAFYEFNTGILLKSSQGSEIKNVSSFNNIIVNFGGGSGPPENTAVFWNQLVPEYNSSNNLYYDSFENDVIFWCTDYSGAFSECANPSDAHYTLSEFRTLRPDLEINSKQLNPQFLSTNPSSPDFLRPNPLTSPAIDAGVVIPGYHCASAGPNSSGCREWYGSAPDIGAYEYNPLGGVTCEATQGGRCRYIDPVNGNDATGNGSFSRPWKTFNNINSYYVGCLGNVPPGWTPLATNDVVYIMDGVINTSIPNGNNAGCSGFNSRMGVFFYGGDAASMNTGAYPAADNVRIKAYPGHHPILDAEGESMSVIKLEFIDNWTIEGLEIRDYNTTDGKEHSCIWLHEYATNVLIQNNDIHHCGGAGGNPAGIKMSEWNYNTTIRNNTIHDGFKVGEPFHNNPGIMMFESNNHKIYNNEIYNFNTGIRYKTAACPEPGDTPKIEIYRNYIHDMYRYGISMGTDNARVYQNIITNSPNGVEDPHGQRAAGCVGTQWEFDRLYENNTYIHNTFYNVGTGYATIDYVDENASGNRFRDNAVQGTRMIYLQDNSWMNDSNYNCFSLDNFYLQQTNSRTLAEIRAQGYDLNSLITTDQFVNPGGLTPNDFKLTPTSPCRTPATDGYFRGAWISDNPGYEIGLMGGGVQPPSITCQTADVNDDLIVNIIDLALVIYNQGQPLTGRAHLNVNSQDSVINYQDVSEVRNRLGQTC